MTTKTITPGRVCRRVATEIKRRLLANKHYNWYVFSQQLSRAWQRQLSARYPMVGGRVPSLAATKTVVAMCNGWVESGGLADRLRGVVSTYQVCKEAGSSLDFRIHFVHPFPLDMFLVPNTYDWRISDADLCYTQPATTPVALEIGSDHHYQALKQKVWLQQHIAQATGTQVHVYTNAMFAYYADYGTAFRELFKPSPQLQHAIDAQLQRLGTDYVSVSTRFMGSLGDFQDTLAVSELPTQLQHQLIERCIEQVEQIHQTHPNSQILVNSDSAKFLARASQLPYVYIIDGQIHHLDVSTATDDLYETFEKTFLDFFLIAHAAHIYRLKTRWMHSTGFPYAASMVYGHPFHNIDFNL